MAAVFYYLNPNVQVFKDHVQSVSVANVPALNRMLADGNQVALTELGAEHRDVIQYFLTFDDAISYFYYGKGLGALRIGGLIFPNADGNMPGMQEFHNTVGQYRGKAIPISLGALGMMVMLDSFSVNLVPDDILVQFSMQCSIIDSTMRHPVVAPVC